MAKATSIQTKKKLKKGTLVQELKLPQQINYIIIAAGVLTIIIGYIIMAVGDDISPLSVTISPLILFFGYCVIIPIGIIYRRRDAAITDKTV